MLPLPGSPSSSWIVYRDKLSAFLRDSRTHIFISFWLFGLINNVLYVLILSAALDLVGSSIPKGIVLLADVVPSLIMKMVAPYFIHRVPYHIRIPIFVLLSTTGMMVISLSPSAQPGEAVAIKMLGVVLASLSSGAGELSFLGLTHYYGRMSLSAWGSGTGGAGLVGAGLYVLLIDIFGFTVKQSLLSSACLPVIMLLSFFTLLPQTPLHSGDVKTSYSTIPTLDSETDDNNIPYNEHNISSNEDLSPTDPQHRTLFQTFYATLPLLIPYMLPLFLVYVSEYTINTSLAPQNLLFPLQNTPFESYRSFYPTYSLIYQLGVCISRSSLALYRLPSLYVPSYLQCFNLVLLLAHALYDFIPNVWIVFLVIFWEGLLGGAVYVNTFSRILDEIDNEEREFALGATSVADSGGICVAGLAGLALEPWVCEWSVKRGRGFCKLA